MRRRVSVSNDGALCVLRGWEAHKIAAEAGIRCIYLGTVQGWTFDAWRLPDFEAACQLRNVALTIEDERPRDVLRSIDGDFSSEVDELGVDDGQLDLFGGPGDAA